MDATVATSLKDWMPLIGVGLGAVLGIAGTFMANIYFERVKASKEKRNLAQAFNGEVSAIIHIVHLRKYIEGLQLAINHMRNTSELYHLQITVKRNYFNVYENNVGSIGILGNGLPKHIATFYTQANSILEDLERLDSGLLKDYPVEIVIEYYEELKTLFQSTIQLGAEIVKEIEAKYS